MRLGVQIGPWWNAAALADLAGDVGDVFDLLWVPDQPLAREAHVLLTALAMRGVGVATCVTHPVGRDPINTARAFAAVSELVAHDREIVMGLSSGGVMPASIYGGDRRVAKVEETIRLIRRLWAGETVALAEFPVLSAAFGYLDDARARLSNPPERPIPIVVSGVGPRITKLAGETADGFMAGSTFPQQSVAALRRGDYEESSGLGRVGAGVAAREPHANAFRLVYQLHVSVSNDAEAAREFSKEHMARVLGNRAFWPALEQLGFDLEASHRIEAAFQAGHGPEYAATLVPDAAVDAFMVWGTPEDCADSIAHVAALAADAGFDEFLFGTPIGPDIHGAVHELAHNVVPRVWPERGSVA